MENYYTTNHKSAGRGGGGKPGKNTGVSDKLLANQTERLLLLRSNCARRSLVTAGRHAVVPPNRTGFTMRVEAPCTKGKRSNPSACDRTWRVCSRHACVFVPSINPLTLET